MKALSRSNSTSTLVLRFALFSTIVAVVGVWVALYASSALALILLCASLILILLIVVPLSVLPAIALVLFAAVPFAHMGLPGILGRFFTAPVLVLSVWCIRSQFERRLQRLPLHFSCILALILLVLALETITSSDVYVSAIWTGCLVLALVYPVYVAKSTAVSDQSKRNLSLAVAVSSCVIGVAALSEFVLGWNPWYFVFSSEALSREWSVFRAKSSLGHPLPTMMLAVFCITFLLFDRTVGKRTRYAGVVLGITALLLTVSRSGVIALIAGVVVGGLVGITTGSSEQRRSAIFGLGGTVIVGVILLSSPLLETRSSSLEGTDSASVRSLLVDQSIELFGERPLLGLGPGVSGDFFENNYGVILENSVFQALLSLGVVGLLAFGLFFLAGFWQPLQSGSSSAVGAAVAYLVAISGFNAFDILPSTLMLLAVAVLSSGTPKVRGSDDSDPPRTQGLEDGATTR